MLWIVGHTKRAQRRVGSSRRQTLRLGCEHPRFFAAYTLAIAMLTACQSSAPSDTSLQEPTIERAQGAEVDVASEEEPNSAIESGSELITKTASYDDVMAGLGLKLGLEHGLFRKGENLRFRVLDREGNPVEGIIVRLEWPTESGSMHIETTTDATGDVPVPAQPDLLGQGAVFKLTRTRAHGTLHFRWTSTFTLPCERGEVAGPVEPLSARQLAGFAVHKAGIDRVYSDAGVTAQAAKRMVHLIGRERAAIEAITGEPPPPVAIAIVPDDSPPMRSELDPEGRPLWVLREADVAADSKTIGMVVHEWGHEILGYGFDQRTAWVQDGFCELLAHRVARELRGEEGDRVVLDRHWSKLHDDESPSQVDLTKSAASPASSLVTMILRYCEEARAYGYAYAFAYWLGLEAQDSDAMQRFLEAVRNEKDMVSTAQELAPPGLSLEQLERSRVIEVLAVERGD